MGQGMTELTAEEQRNLESVTDVLQYWNTQNIQGILSYYDPDIAWHHMAARETYHGHAGVEKFLTEFITAFPDITFTVIEKVPRGNQVAERWRIDGTHLGNYRGIPPTGRAIRIEGMGLVTMRDGKFLVDNFYYDAMTIAEQMRIIPPLSIGETLPGRVGLWAMVHSGKVAAGAGVLVAGVAAALVGRKRR